ncbi:polysaccharide deacetylase family protein [Geobacter pickeringii]|uniref:Polysaccharide deacetylase n=1 Tax=Geobacter pickeringii TaxID=345632 RepID=A0A0B5BJ35_9BACT|nr:polysaccharide deacetylase family protein [Geobacter pickeringii]AJE04071.1 polysaccharide deacetylase [Geobacter pickeringii]
MRFHLLLPTVVLALVSALPALAAKPAPPAVLSQDAPVLSRGMNVPILLYHRLGPTVADGMTIKTTVFEEHLKYLRENGYTVIPLRQVVDFYLKKGPAPAPKSVVIVEDDAHKSVYSDMLPLVKKYRVPVTVFVYPSAISNAKYALTWDQIRELKKTGLFDFQSHTYWHPNFKKDRKKLKPAEFEKFVDMQLKKSKDKIEKELGGKVDLLAWPFGIYDDYLLKKAAEAGYVSTFTIERRHATPAESVTRLPRYLLINADQGKAFAQILAGTAPKRNVVY